MIAASVYLSLIVTYSLEAGQRHAVRRLVTAHLPLGLGDLSFCIAQKAMQPYSQTTMPCASSASQAERNCLSVSG